MTTVIQQILSLNLHKNIGDVTLGADPEFFLQHKDGTPLVAYDFIQADKWAPMPIDDLGSAILQDNVMVEFNIPPAISPETWVENLNKVLTHLKTVVGDDVLFNITPSVSYPPEFLQDPRALIFGCEPDMNAYSQDVNPPPQLGDDAGFRTAGGHIHIGYDKRSLQRNYSIVKWMDALLGCWSILVDKDGEARRQLYGKAGALRHKPYGVEYRTLSNFWLTTPELQETAYNLTIIAVNAALQKKVVSFIDAKQAIDTNCKEIAQRVLEQCLEVLRKEQ